MYVKLRTVPLNLYTTMVIPLSQKKSLHANEGASMVSSAFWIFKTAAKVLMCEVNNYVRLIAST